MTSTRAEKVGRTHRFTELMARAESPSDCCSISPLYMGVQYVGGRIETEAELDSWTYNVKLPDGRKACFSFWELNVLHNLNLQRIPRTAQTSIMMTPLAEIGTQLINAVFTENIMETFLRCSVQIWAPLVGQSAVRPPVCGLPCCRIHLDTQPELIG